VTAACFLLGRLGSHRRGRILAEALEAQPVEDLPSAAGSVFLFGEEFQAASQAEQERLIQWTKQAGRVLVLLPPFSTGRCERPVSWWVERIEPVRSQAEGLTGYLVPEIQHRLQGQLQVPAILGSRTERGPVVATHRVHPAAGLFLVTCLPLWSLAVLEVPAKLEQWLEEIRSMAGTPAPGPPTEERPLEPEHFGFLIFLLSGEFASVDDALAALGRSPIFAFAPERARRLLADLTERGLIQGARPTRAAEALVTESPYAAYAAALRRSPA